VVVRGVEHLGRGEEFAALLSERAEGGSGAVREGEGVRQYG
jgi:hypothetical protein